LPRTFYAFSAKALLHFSLFLYGYFCIAWHYLSFVFYGLLPKQHAIVYFFWTIADWPVP